MNKEKEGEDRKQARPLSSEKTVGELLLEARKKDGRSRSEISRVTRIPEASLKYLETDNFDMLPAPVYVIGFLRSYASELGMDVGYILNKYQVHSGHDHKTRGDHWEEKETEEEQSFDYTGLAGKLALPLAAAAVVIVMAIILLRNGEEVDVKPPSAIPQAEEFVDSATARKLNGMEIEKESRSGRIPETAEAESDLKPVESGPPESREFLEPMELRLAATSSDSTWFDIITISLRDSGPDTTYHDFILFPGNVKVLRADRAIVLRTVGNAGGFTAELNGRKLPVMGNRHEIVRNIYLGRDSASLETE
ncbi:MAG: hypothetical protein GF417_04485 [Candidatus Latescibacteria bacterium]|nr:hypothetical protein [bacterium]MBD3423680.1 hypothetical protein [Candidatus Latescibacterota bacterium]